MRQIPSEGEFCGECCMQTEAEAFYCKWYDMYPQKVGFSTWKRLPQCLKDNPQVLTLADREKLYADAFIDGMNHHKEITLCISSLKE